MMQNSLCTVSDECQTQGIHAWSGTLFYARSPMQSTRHITTDVIFSWKQSYLRHIRSKVYNHFTVSESNGVENMKDGESDYITANYLSFHSGNFEFSTCSKSRIQLTHSTNDTGTLPSSERNGVNLVTERFLRLGSTTDDVEYFRIWPKFLLHDEASKPRVDFSSTISDATHAENVLAIGLGHLSIEKTIRTSNKVWKSISRIDLPSHGFDNIAKAPNRDTPTWRYL